MLITIVVIVSVIMAAVNGPMAGLKALLSGLAFIVFFWIVVTLGLGALLME